MIADYSRLIQWHRSIGMMLRIVVCGVALSLAAITQAQPLMDRVKAAELLTHQLVGLNTRLQHASPTAGVRILEELHTVATERKTLLTELIENNPGAVLRVTLPRVIRAGMPDEVQGHLEQHVDLAGELEVLYEDYEDGSHRLRHYLKVNNERTALHFVGDPPGLLGGTPAGARGVLLDDDMALDSDEGIFTLATGGGADGGANAGTPAPVPNTFGEQHTAVLLVNFNDLPQEPWTVAEARATLFGTVSDFFLENSYGQTWLNGDVFGWFTLGVDPAGCPATDIEIAARGAAAAQGIDLSGYSRLIYAFPDIGCSWSGQATVGGNPSGAWLDGSLLNSGIVSHELGHNFGLYHSHALECGSDVVGENCLTAEYGDALDRMGNNNAGHFNAFQKTRLGWLDYATSPPIVTAGTSGSYQLETFAAQAHGTKAIRLPRDVDPVNGQNRWYFLEFRQALGFDSFLATSRYGTSVTNGLIFRLGVEGDPNSSTLLDMTPDSHRYDWDDMALPAGVGYTDAASGTTIALEQFDANGATVSIALGQPECVHRNPDVYASPSQGPWVQPGTAVDFDITVTNNDSSACTDATLELTATVPGGWQADITPPTVTLIPGTSATVTLTVTSAVSAADGFYPVGVTAVELNDSAYSGSVTVTYVVSGGNQPPVAVDDTATTSRSTPVSINVLSNDSDPDGDSLALVSVGQPTGGNATFGANGSLTYEPATDFQGMESFPYTVSDGQSTASATVTINVKKGGKGGGSKGGGSGKGRK